VVVVAQVTFQRAPTWKVLLFALAGELMRGHRLRVPDQVRDIRIC